MEPDRLLKTGLDKASTLEISESSVSFGSIQSQRTSGDACFLSAAFGEKCDDLRLVLAQSILNELVDDLFHRSSCVMRETHSVAPDFCLLHDRHRHEYKQKANQFMGFEAKMVCLSILNS